MVDYYGPFAERIWPSTPRNRTALIELVRSFEAAGADEVIFSPTIASLDQPELLAEAVLQPA